MQKHCYNNLFKKKETMIRAASSHNLSPLSAFLPVFTKTNLKTLLPIKPLAIFHRKIIPLYQQTYHTFSSRFNSLSIMTGPPCLVKATASLSGEAGSTAGREILVQHLLVKEDDQKLLLELQKRTAQGEDLSDLAIEYSICPSKEEGGMLGWVRKGQMVPEFEEAAFGAQLNKVVRCKTQFGWHLLQVLSEREESVLGNIHPTELHEKMQDPTFLEDAQLIDVREPDEVEKASLPGFEVLSLRSFGKWAPDITTKLDTQKDTYVMCHHGMRSLQVAQWLQTQGFKKIYNVSGGIHEYALKVDPSVPTY